MTPRRSLSRGEVRAARGHRHHAQRRGARVRERAGGRGGGDGKDEEAQTQDHPDQAAGVRTPPPELSGAVRSGHTGHTGHTGGTCYCEAASAWERLPGRSAHSPALVSGGPGLVSWPRMSGPVTQLGHRTRTSGGVSRKPGSGPFRPFPGGSGSAKGRLIPSSLQGRPSGVSARDHEASEAGAGGPQCHVDTWRPLLPPARWSCMSVTGPGTNLSVPLPLLLHVGRSAWELPPSRLAAPTGSVARRPAAQPVAVLTDSPSEG